MTGEDCESTTGRTGFPVTRWSVVDAVGNGDSKIVGEALEGICRDYWYPLYAFARRSGQTAEDAKDLTQGFFCGFSGEKVDRSGGSREGKVAHLFAYRLSSLHGQGMALDPGANSRWGSNDGFSG